MERLKVLEAKRDAGYRAADEVFEGMVIGLGTGSTVEFTLKKLGDRVAEGLSIIGVPTSYQTAMRARQYNIPLTTLDDHIRLDLAIDGADQVDSAKRLIKGGGAAHSREKCVADASDRLIIVVDKSKVSHQLDADVPIEVLPFAAALVMRRLQEIGGEPRIREGVKKDGPVITDNGNFIIDCSFGLIPHPEELESYLNSLPGVLASGLFTGYTEKTVVIVGEMEECTR